MFIRQSTALAYTNVKQRDDPAFDKLLARSEGREAKDMSGLTVALALPGIQAIAATQTQTVKLPEAVGASGIKTGSVSLPGVTTAPAPKP
jgi:hypothetical protein